jgi:hypothetical protein
MPDTVLRTTSALLSSFRRPPPTSSRRSSSHSATTAAPLVPAALQSPHHLPVCVVREKSDAQVLDGSFGVRAVRRRGIGGPVLARGGGTLRLGLGGSLVAHLVSYRS